MPEIVKDFQGQTVITTFETTPAMAFDLVEALEAAYRDCIRLQPGFIAAGAAHERRSDADLQLLTMDAA
jgi:hypothetical protein